jgi:DNA polymerase-1
VVFTGFLRIPHDTSKLTMKPRPTLYILDAYSLIFQVFHALPLMTSPTGEPTHAVFGIFRDLLNLNRDRKPDYMAAAFDGAGPVFRSELYPEYKANRAAMPEDLVPQIPVIRRVFEGFRVPVLIHEGMEADDIIATVARRGAERGLDVFICTADKDARQLLGDQIRIYNLRKQSVLDVAALRADWGVGPEQVVDLLALSGDSVDNVPGVPGIGLKTGAKLLDEFGTLENLFANVDRVAGAKRKENLREHQQTALLSRKLVILRDDLELDLDWDALRGSPPDLRALKPLCVECGFHRFLDELTSAARQQPLLWSDDQGKGNEATGASGPSQAGQEAEPSSAPPWKYDYTIVDTADAFAEFMAELRRQGKFCVDTETTAIDPLRADLVGLSFSWQKEHAYYLPIRGPAGSRLLEEGATLAALAPVLADPAVEKVGQNIKYDMLALARAGVEIGGPMTDTMVLSYLLESGERNHNLDQLAHRFLDHAMIPISDLIGKGKKQLTMDQVEVARVAKYAGEDADATWRLESILAPRVRAEGLWTLYAELERPLIAVLARMERAGVKVDVARLRQLSGEFAARLTAIEEEIYAEAGQRFNIASLPQLRQILFEELKLPATKKTPGGEPSTDNEVLEELAIKHRLPRLLIEHRQLAKLKGTYLDALPELADPEGRIHASFNQSVAATGRLSSSDPNLQNIPIRTETGGQIRQAFVPGFAGWSLLTADYSQIELRVLAHYSADPALVQAFAADDDIHTAVAAEIFGVAEANVDSNMRRVAKTVNFGVIYGLSAFGLAARLGITREEASAFIEAYFHKYSGVDAFITRTLETARQSGRVETILGRRRSISGIKNTTGRVRNPSERFAINTVIQGSAADLIKRAMLLVDERLRSQKMEARMLLQIHDELVFEAPDAELPALAELVREAMTTALELLVPIKVDLASGLNWLDVETMV